MPNHVLSIIKVSDKEVLYGLENENREIDFNVIIPSPKIFNEFDYSFCNFSSRIEKLDNFIKTMNPPKLDKETLTPLVEKFLEIEFPNGNHPYKLEMVVIQLLSFYECGFVDPCEWATEFWETKWNAYEVDKVSPTELKFYTAWNHPFPIIRGLSKKFPNEVIEVYYASQDYGYNCGFYTIKNGMTVSHTHYNDFSYDARKLSATLWKNKEYLKELKDEMRDKKK